jgi:ABC-2 type transport system ATP-binding protein
MAAVTLHNLTKSYGKEKTVAVNAVSLSVEKGELFGLIGPDGAGKTSIFRMLTTLLLPDSGSATVDGFDIVKDYKQIRNTVGYMPGKFSLYQDLTIEENLEFFATVFNTTIQENYKLIEDIYVQIEPFKTRKAGKLSGGMKQKLALCCALIHKPTVLFLDEPTTGVDAVSRKEFWDMLKRLKEQGITILVSTPYMDEANLCDRIALMQTGNVLSVDTPQNITKAYGESMYAVKAKNMIKLLRDVQAMKPIKSCFAFGEFHHVVFNEDTENEHHLFLEKLKSMGHEELLFQRIAPGIEDCFIKLLATTNQ